LLTSVSMAPHRFVLALGLGLLALSGCTRVTSTTQLSPKQVVPEATTVSAATSEAPAKRAEPRRLQRAQALFAKLYDKPRKPPAAPAVPPVYPEDLIAVGYASITAQPSTDVAQRRLMAARASRIDAYRNMAELVFGVNFGSESAIDDSRLQNDVTRTRVNGRLQGVEIISIEPLGNDTYQTTLRLPGVELARLRSATAAR
jgi:outer membrane protein FlgP